MAQAAGGFVVVYSLLIVAPIVRFCVCSLFCCAFPCVLTSFAIIFIRKRELVVLLYLVSWCLVVDIWLFLTVPWVGLQFVIVVYPDSVACFHLNLTNNEMFLFPFYTMYIFRSLFALQEYVQM